MLSLFSFFFVLSLVGNGILIWYTRKLIENLNYGINNVDEMQKLLNEYADLLEPMATMENYYNDPAITSAVANTKLVIEACKAYKNTLIEDYDEEIKENQEGQEKQENSAKSSAAQEGYKTYQESGPQAPPRKAEATIGPIR